MPRGIPDGKCEEWRSAMALRILVAGMLLLGIASLRAEAACLASGQSTSLLVTGEVTKPTVFNLKRLQQFSPAQENVTYFTMNGAVTNAFTGVLLWDVLNLSPAGPIVTNTKIKNDILHKVIIVTGCDGYQSVFGAGEVDPFFGDNQIMLAYAVNGQPLGSDGLAQLVAPGDKAGGRFVFIIDQIEVADPTK
jgi:DMSO/TMAO reductase YedYZ molybdopterin-dependent catalytic subunit